MALSAVKRMQCAYIIYNSKYEWAEDETEFKKQ
jgi:hypothetical protein